MGYTQSRIAVLPNGDVAEVVLQDGGGFVAAHWHDGQSWSDWQLVATGAVDVSIAAAGADTAYISVMTGAAFDPQIRARSIYRFTAKGFDRLDGFDQ